MSNMKILEVKNLNKSFDNKEILKDINFSISSGRIVGLLGKNGAGKTTFIKLINDLLTPTSGEILINGNKVGVETKKVVSYLPGVHQPPRSCRGHGQVRRGGRSRGNALLLRDGAPRR